MATAPVVEDERDAEREGASESDWRPIREFIAGKVIETDHGWFELRMKT